ncbi:MAG: carboxypeptidase regulatory-like domain-containing protein [Aeromicrobium sp.]
MRSNSEPPPRHRSDHPAVVFPSDSPDARQIPATLGIRGLGFGTYREVRSEMSPVIHRPAGSGDPEPDRHARVSIAGPGIPTAASFVDETDATIGEPSDDDGESSSPVPADDPTSQRRPPVQRRRRRLLGWGSEPSLAPEPPPVVSPPSPRDETGTADTAEGGGPSDRSLTRPRRARTLYMAAPPVGPAEEDPASTESADEATLAATGAVVISGHVVSTRGRGLSGVTVVVVDADDQVVGTTITGRRGRYVVDGVAAGGAYRLGARDTIDGDFIDSWHGGDDAASATVLEPTDDGAVADIDVTLTGRVAIDAEIAVKRRKVRVEVEVIDRSTGLPGEGTVTISTDQFSTQLPLTDGRATVTLLTAREDQDGSHRDGRRLRIAYPGSRHIGPATRTIRVR